MEAPTPEKNNSQIQLPAGAAAEIPAIISEGKALLRCAQGLKPGIQTSEFYLLAGFNVVALLLIYLGKIDGTMALGILGTVDGYYVRQRSTLKVASGPANQDRTEPVPPATAGAPLPSSSALP